MLYWPMTSTGFAPACVANVANGGSLALTRVLVAVNTPAMCETVSDDRATGIVAQFAPPTSAISEILPRLESET